VCKKLSALALEEEVRSLLASLDVAQSTDETNAIIRKLLKKAGTDCAKNDADPYGDGDQRMVSNEPTAQILRNLFAMGGDIVQQLIDYAMGRSKMSDFAWSCIVGDSKGVEKTLAETKGFQQRRKLLEQRLTVMRFPILIFVVAISKHKPLLHRYTSRPIEKMDHVGVFRILLQYGAKSNA